MIREYNRTKAVEYAQKWALGKNPQYYYFGGIGGDCTNFISQCILAGDAVMNYNRYYGWFYIDSNYRSPSWTSVDYLRRFLLTNDKLGPYGHIDDLKNLQIGDILQLRQNFTHFNHTLIISEKYGDEIYVCAHSNPALNVSLNTYPYIEMIGIKIDGIYV